MKVLLNAYDSFSFSGPFPNLALMKLSAYHKSKGDQVALIGKGLARQDRMDDPDLVYISCVFSENGAQARGSRWMYSDAEFMVGGSGVDLARDLPPAVHSMLPDYEIYDQRGIPGWPYAIGFSTRGCGRRCPFCVVPRKEGKIRQEVPLDQVVGDHDRLVLLDNNLTMDPDLESKLRWLADWGGKVNFSQGLDIRVVARRPRLAGLLADVKYYDRKFGTKLVTFAYDHPRHRRDIEKGCEALREAGINLRQDVQFFVLTNYNTTIKEDVQRCNHLKGLGTSPYVMVYNKKKAPLEVRRLQRWANARQIFWVVDWDDYDSSVRGHMADLEVET